MGWLVLARVLVRTVRFGRWRAALGRRVPARVSTERLALEENRVPRRLAAGVERAAARLPGASRCLPQAIALHWMLGRRGLESILVVGVRRGDARGGLDDLHAWVSRSGEVLIGAREEPHVPLIAFER